MPSYAQVDSPPKEVGHGVVAFDFSTEKVQILHYWLENYNGSETTTRNGRTYGLYKAQRVKFNYLYRDIDFYELRDIQEAIIQQLTLTGEDGLRTIHLETQLLIPSFM